MRLKHSVNVSYFISGEDYRPSNNSFMFSLQNKDNLLPFKAPVCKIRNAIYSSRRCGPTFGGGHDLYIADNPHVNNKSYTYFGFSYKPPQDYSHGSEKTSSLLAGRCDFTPNEIEVFY